MDVETTQEQRRTHERSEGLSAWVEARRMHPVRGRRLTIVKTWVTKLAPGAHDLNSQLSGEAHPRDRSLFYNVSGARSAETATGPDSMNHARCSR